MDKKTMGMQLEGTLAFPQRGKAARFSLRSSGFQPETMPALHTTFFTEYPIAYFVQSQRLEMRQIVG